MLSSSVSVTGTALVVNLSFPIIVEAVSMQYKGCDIYCSDFVNQMVLTLQPQYISTVVGRWNTYAVQCGHTLA